VAKAPPDGYTMMVTVNTFTITPALYKNLQYDPVKDFTTIGRVANGNVALVVNPSVLQAKNLQELATAAKSRKLSYSSPGNGTPQHLAIELLKRRLGVDILHVPYKGAAQALTDLLGGQVQLAVLPVHTALPHARAGKLTVVAVSGERRSVLAPDSPSFAELGLKNLDIDLYFWIAGPAGLPREIVQKWNQEIASIVALPEVRETLMKQGMVTAPGSPEEIATQIRSDVERWKKFIAETGITAD
ncbi:MAG TPA: tripartite tricarboxylate transporter substrate-binding protein, partial [Burkholderiales bacterium]|nr:tripartite tricarboxylate transporter substrate-binding protein [Burkholderiales bacterium]